MSIRYTEWLDQAGIKPSVGSKGDSYDNALAETIKGLYKAELIHHRGPWENRESVELATLEWEHWFNHIRWIKPIGGIPAAEAEANYGRQLAASSTSTEVSTQANQPPRNPGPFSTVHPKKPNLTQQFVRRG